MKSKLVGRTTTGNDVVQARSGKYYIRLSTGLPLQISEKQYLDGLSRGEIQPVEV